MRAIIIDDKDARALLDSLKLASFEKSAGGYGVEQHEAWSSLPEGLRNTIIEGLHRRFHYVVCRWLQDQGCNVTK
jgi:hypothetical protein